MGYRQPTNMQEFEQAVQRNIRMTGRFDQTATHMSCIFCGAPEWTVWRLVTTHEDMAVPRTCRECKRSGAMLEHFTAGSVAAFPVQLAGPAQAAWMHPQILRWDGCPAKQFTDGLGRPGLYINIADRVRRQMVCTLKFEHEEQHDFVDQDSAEGKASRYSVLPEDLR